MKLIIIHLGKNPKNGGKPPKESKFKKINNFVILLKLLKNNWFKKNVLNK